MNNIHLSILGSAPFINILNELEFSNSLNPDSKLNLNNKKILDKILFTENLKIKEVRNCLLKNEPVFLEPYTILINDLSGHWDQHQ